MRRIPRCRSSLSSFPKKGGNHTEREGGGASCTGSGKGDRVSVSGTLLPLFAPCSHKTDLLRNYTSANGTSPIAGAPYAIVRKNPIADVFGMGLRAVVRFCRTAAAHVARTRQKTSCNWAKPDYSSTYARSASRNWANPDYYMY